MRVIIASTACMAVLAGCAHNVPGPTVTETRTAIHTVAAAPSTVTKSIPAPMPVSCQSTISDALLVERLVGKGAALNTQMIDLLSEFQVDLAVGRQMEASKIADKIAVRKVSLGDTIYDLDDELATLKSDLKECENATR